MARRSLPKGVHRVARRLAGGRSRFHFYAWRGGPKFWTDDRREPEDPEFLIAFAKVTERRRPGVAMTPELVDGFLSSPAMPRGERTRADYRLWALRFAGAFADDPAAMFEEPASRAEVNDWRRAWEHSPRQYDYAGTVVTRVLNWALDEGKIGEHHCHRLRKVYEVDRSAIVWTSADREAFEAVAPEWARRILCAACETGLRPGDLIRLTRQHVERTPRGRRIVFRTAKRGRSAGIPVMAAMGALIDATPPGRLLILTSARGRPLTEHRASEGVRQWRDKAGLSPKLRLQDARGTAATKLLRAGLTLNQIAGHMGWSPRHAGNVIEHYARVSPDETDAILVKLEAARGAPNGAKL